MTLSTLTQMDFPLAIVIATIGGGIIIAIISIVAIRTDAHRKANETRQREETRREIAAYIAEGSMTPDEGERLLKAGNTRSVGQAIHEAING